MQAIAARNLGFVYPDGTEALRGVSFELAAGRSLAYLGPNGAGKSATVHILAAAMRPTSGSATIHGFDVVRQRREVHRVIGLATQDVHLDWIISVRDNLRFFGLLQGLSREEVSRRVRSVLAEFGLADRARATAWSVSGGQARRLQLAIALLRNPRVLFLDEPTIGLDPSAKSGLLGKLRALLGGGTTVFYSSNDMAELEALCSHVVFLDRGELVSSGPMPMFISEHSEGQVATISFGEEPPETLLSAIGAFAGANLIRLDASTCRIQCETCVMTSILKQLLSEGAAVSDIAIREPSLEDAFLRLTKELGHEEDSSAS